MDLQALTKQIEGLESEPPFDSWQPQNCGEIDIEIKADGTWFHDGSPIGRIGLVKLFAQVLVKEQDGYYLKTPVEKMKIKVESTPFIINQWQLHDTEQGPAIEVTSNLDHKAIISEQHPLKVEGEQSDPLLTVMLHRGLSAKVHRNVYYQWIEQAQEKTIKNKTHLVIKSAGQDFSLGQLD